MRLEALSDEEREVPGVDIKFWMRGKTLEAVNSQIAAAGGDRRATVRSDVLLFIPPFYKSLWSIPDDYLVFVGEQHGSLIEQEWEFTTNLVYPWLDNQSFNKWFIPDGATTPLGAMANAEAELYDFRKKSFGKLFDFLRSKGLIAEFLRQEELPLDDRSVSIICGYTCAGKTTASQLLAEKFDYLHVEASDFMYFNYYIRHGVHGDVTIGDFAERALIEKPEIAAEKIADYLLSEGLPPTIISGFRSPKEIDWMRGWLQRVGGSASVMFVDAPEIVRFERMEQRARSGDVNDLRRFQHRDEQQRRMGLDQIYSDPETTLLSNTGSIDHYLAEVINRWGGRPRPSRTTADLILQLRSIPTMKLEDAILVALFTHWAGEEDRAYFTTTEIAKIIQADLAKRNHKDNVSRYFNQYFYPYYDISTELNNRRYRLSNTGHGKALRTIRRLTARPQDPPSMD